MARWEADKDYFQQCQASPNSPDPGCQAHKDKHLSPPPFSSKDSYVTIIKRALGDNEGRFLIRPRMSNYTSSDLEVVPENTLGTQWGIYVLTLLLISILAIYKISKAYARKHRPHVDYEDILNWPIGSSTPIQSHTQARPPRKRLPHVGRPAFSPFDDFGYAGYLLKVVIGESSLWNEFLAL
ncbi:hypothetical protein MMC14_005947 [Varicellaria rhodocarpa]|nr:hypothetical protein [Varicellaria rhodocarpa]